MNYNKNVEPENEKGGERSAMIVYTKLWETMKARGISQYKLIRQYGISTGQLDRLRKNDNVSTYTLNALCEILDCDLSEIATYIPDEKQAKKQN